VRRRLARLAVPALAVTLLACGPGGGVQTVVFWQFWPADVMAPILAAFEREHPRYRVRMERLAWQDGFARIRAALESGEGPDLCELGSTYMPRMLASGRLTDCTAGVADLVPELRGWELCSLGDVRYGIPWLLGTRALFYNKTLLARAGLDSTRPPETWAELHAAAAAIQRLGGGVRGCGVQAAEPQVLFKKFMPFAWGNGGRILSDDLRAAGFDSPRTVEALEFYLSLREVGRVDRQEPLDRAFREGRIGFQISGGWLVPAIAREAPGLRYGVALVPRPDSERGFHASFAGGELLVGFQASKRKRAALELARFLVRPGNALALARSSPGVQPAAAGAETTAYYRARPHERMLIRQFETAVPAPSHPAWLEMEAVIEDEIGQAIDGRKGAARAVADAQGRLAALVAGR
jgi:multiple sugar transport system substrate-binding protein